MSLPAQFRRGTPLFLLALAGCASQTGSVDLVDAGESDSGRTTITISTSVGFNAGLLDASGNCRFWAQNRLGSNMRPCVDEAPSCGAAINSNQVDVLVASEDEASDRIADANLVTEGFYFVPMPTTVQATTFDLTRRIAREGCDLIVIGEPEWIELRKVGGGRDIVRYLRVQWGTQQATANTIAAHTGL